MANSFENILIAFFNKHDKRQLRNVAKITKRFRNDQDVVLEYLCTKYGVEPSSVEGIDAEAVRRRHEERQAEEAAAVKAGKQSETAHVKATEAKKVKPAKAKKEPPAGSIPPGEPADEGGKPVRSKKKIVLLTIVLLLVAGGGAAGYFFREKLSAMFGKEPEKQEAPEATQPAETPAPQPAEAPPAEQPAPQDTTAGRDTVK